MTKPDRKLMLEEIKRVYCIFYGVDEGLEEYKMWPNTNDSTVKVGFNRAKEMEKEISK